MSLRDIPELCVPTPVHTELWALPPPHAHSHTRPPFVSGTAVYSGFFELVCRQYYSSKKSLIIGEVHSPPLA